MRRLISLIVIVLATSPAYAEDEWAKGVSKDNQTKANALFAEGNQLFAQQAHGPALEKYKAAVGLWDHPLIRFNIAITEIRLDRILDAADDLEAALRFGQSPFTKEQYQQALDYEKLVGGRVGNVEAECTQADAAVLLDGKPWFKCPGKQKLRVLAGEHVIVGESKGYMTISRRLVVAGGKTSSEKLELLPIESVVKLEYSSPRWLPWTITGAGVAVALGGLGVWFDGKNQMNDFENQFAMLCPTGCDADLNTNPVEQQLADVRDGAVLKGKIAVTMMIAGGAVTVAGVVWAIINRPRRVLPKDTTFEVAPTQGGASAAVGWRF